VKQLTQDEILAADDLVTEEVEVPEWDGAVLVRSLRGDERDAYEASIVKGEGEEAVSDLENMRAKLCARSIVDADGARMFSDDDIAALGRKSAAGLQRIFMVARRLSRMTAEDVKELAENFGAGQGGSSPSD